MITKRKRRLAALKGWRSRKRNPSKRKTLKRVGLALRKWVRGNPKSWADWTLRAKVHGIASARESAKIHRSYGDAARIVKMSGDWYGVYTKETGKSKPYDPRNPSRVKGRKVKGGRAVTLRNMKTVTITRHRNGAVSVRGVQLKGRKR
jgi:hypothetical protein